jgi:hypothetical protein
MTKESNIMAGKDLQADATAVAEFMGRIVEGWDALAEHNPMIEIRCISVTRNITIARFALDWIDEAVEHAMRMNAAKQNIYMCVNPVDGFAQIETGKGAKDDNILAAFYNFADADDEGAMANVLSFAGPKFTMSVKTGTTPYVRGHAYWRLEEPVRNLQAWRDVQQNISAVLGTDPTVVNPSRIMRVAGTVSWPNADKQGRGYIPELVTLRTEFSTDREPVPFERMMRAFPASAVRTPAVQTAMAGLQIDLGRQAMDRALAQQDVLAGNNWHHNVVRLVASYVSKGLADAEIHAITDNFTLSGYTVDDTRNEVQKAIDSARGKGFAPTPDPALAPIERSVSALPPSAQAAPSEAGETSPPTWPTPVQAINELLLPRRQWIYARDYIRGFVSVTASAGGIGKTSLTMVEGMAVACGRPLLGEDVHESCRVWILNLEDDRNEMLLRLAAAMRHYGVTHEEIADRLYLDAEDTIEVVMAVEGREGLQQNDALLAYMIQKVKDLGIGLVILDPFVSSHLVNENSNSSIQAVTAMFRKLARETGCGVHIVHHVRKGNGDDATIDSVRGAGSLIGAARSARVINRLTEKEALRLGVPDLEAAGIFRVDNGKANLAPPASKAVYRRMVGVQLANSEWIGVAVNYTLPDPFDGITAKDARKVQQAVGEAAETEPARANVQAKNWVGVIVAEVLGMDVEEDKARIKSLVKTWIDTDVLRVEQLPDKRQSRDVPCVVVGEWIRWDET